MEPMRFATRAEFRAWLEGHFTQQKGIWLLFGKSGGPTTVTADAALEEALCFGWIDGRMRRLDEVSYVKYFAPRRSGSNWSARNKALAVKLEQQGIMTASGREKISQARKNGEWDKPPRSAITEEQIAALADLLVGHEPAYTNFMAMPPSVKKSYAGGYFALKTDAGRRNRLDWTIDRLNRNLKPM